MPTLLLIRHGRTAANAAGVLAGWTPGVDLDETGRAQADALAARLVPLRLAALVTSPLERCRQTTAALAAQVWGPGRRGGRLEPLVDDRLGEVRYGEWTGRKLASLAREPLWRVVQAHPSAMTFPGEEGESLRAMQQRAVDAVREHDARVAAGAGQDAVWAAVSHGDVIKAVLADALGLHLDSFQRIVVDPCSVSVVRYTALRPFVLRVNDTGGDLGALAPAARRPRRASRSGPGADSDAAVGGGAGPADPAQVPTGPRGGAS